MAFQAILHGNECGPSNPLQNLLKHADRHQVESRFDPFAQPNHSPSPLASSSTALNNHSQPSFLVQDIRNELDLINSSNYLPQHPNNQTWQNQFHPSSLGPSVSSDEMLRMEHSFRSLAHRPSPSQAQSDHWSQLFSETENAQTSAQPPHSNHSVSISRSQTHSAYSTNLPVFPHQTLLNRPPFFSQPITHSSATTSAPSKAQIVELSAENWEAEFEKIGSQLDQQFSAVHLESQAGQEQSAQIQSGLESATIVDQETTEENREADAEFLKSLEATWRGLASNLNSGSLTLPPVSNWAEMTDEDFIGPDLSSHPSTRITTENVVDFLQNPEPYPYQSNNPFLGHPDPFQEGHRLIQTGATLSEAALAFEAACRLDESRAEAWRMLGETQAADEKEQLAIKAFQKAVGCGDLHDQSPWLSLAVCWVNEGQEMRALAILERWLMSAYPAIAANVPPASVTSEVQNNPWARHGMVVEKFLQAARAGPESREGVGKETVRSQVVDVDVQVALGVLFYSNAEYDRARDCFESALGVKPHDFSLWNRLGATLANAGRSEDAIGAYERALELRPTFTRAIYNLAVSCLNIHCYKQAVEHLLAALSFHTKAASFGDRPLLSDGDGSENLWFTLRRALLCLDRSDLADLAVPKTDLGVFRQHGFDF